LETYGTPEGAANNAAHDNNILYPKSRVKWRFALTAFSGDAQGGAVSLWIAGGRGLKRVPDTGADGYLIPSRQWRKERQRSDSRLAGGICTQGAFS